MSLTSDTFVVLDFDRTLGDTDKLFRTLMEVLADYPQVDTIALEQEAGAAFDTVQWLRGKLEADGTPELWDAIKHDFAKRCKSVDFLLPGAKELLNYLEQADIPHGIFTYGGDEWQQMKLVAAGLTEVPTVITRERKGEVIARWQRPDGTYELPPEYAQRYSQVVPRIVFLDDKLSSFEGMPMTGTIKIHVGTVAPGVDMAGILQANTMYDALEHVKQQG